MEAVKMQAGDITLRDRVKKILADEKMTIKELSEQIGCSRSAVSQYLNNKYISDSTNIEERLWEFISGQDPAADGGEIGGLREKTENYASRDYTQVMGVCGMCQRDVAKGLVVARSGYGKTHALQFYAQKKSRVIYIEGNENMGCKDILRRMEGKIGMPRSYGSIDERTEKIIDFFNVNSGYLIIMDEADKLINKYTQKKIEILRHITDGARVGLVLAGETALEQLIRTYDARFANRMDCYYKLAGLSEEEVRGYLEGYDVDDMAMVELVRRARDRQNGCFRLLDRTLTNILRILREKGKTKITLKVVNEASTMMML